MKEYFGKLIGRVYFYKRCTQKKIQNTRYLCTGREKKDREVN